MVQKMRQFNKNYFRKHLYYNWELCYMFTETQHKVTYEARQFDKNKGHKLIGRSDKNI